MKKLILLLVLLASTLTNANANLDTIGLDERGFCYLGQDVDYSYSSLLDYQEANLYGLKANMSCETQRDLTFLLSSVQGIMGTVMAICGAAPEPVFSKTAMAVIALGMGGLTTANLIIRYAPCKKKGEEFDLTPEESLFVKSLACEKAGGVFDTGASECRYLPE